MKTSVICFFAVVLLFCFEKCKGQSCSTGDPSGPPGGGVSPPGMSWPLDVLNSFDPNDIVPPASVGKQAWVRRDQVLAFMIRCENHPDSATAPAQEVWIDLPLHRNMDLSSFQLGDIGFGDFFISVPPNLQAYSTVVDASASLQVKVQIEAGIDRAKNKAFWHFRSLDPLTNQPTRDPFVGFLLVNDSTRRGEAFVNFSIKPKSSTQTWDKITAQAFIQFDSNIVIATPMVMNTIDASHPKSRLSVPTAPDQNHLKVKWSGTDNDQSGLAYYTIFVAVNDSAFVPWLVGTTQKEALLKARLGDTYRFMTIARDSVGNVEPVDSVTQITFTADMITATTSAILQLNKYEIKAYPNPHQEHFTVSISGLENERLALRLYDPIGRLVLTQNHQNLPAEALLSLGTATLAKGLYLLEVWIDGQRGVLKIIKN